MKKIQTIILGASLSNITNEKTGEVKPLTKIMYTVDRDNTEKLIGPALLECYKIGNHMDKISKYIMRSVTIEIDEIPTKNGSKYSITKIDNIELK